MTPQRIKTIKFYHSPTNGTYYVLTDRQDEPVVRPNIKRTVSIHKNTNELQRNNLLRPDNEKTASRKHNETTVKRKRGPREARLDTKRKMGGKRMQPITPENRHNTNQVLRYCVTTLNSETLRKLLNIEFPDPMYGHVSTVVDPFEDMLGLKLPTAKTPLQYGSNNKNTRPKTRKKDEITRDRKEKAAIQQNFDKPEILLPIDYCYALYGSVDQLCDTPVIDYMNIINKVLSADAVSVSKEELEQAKKRALQQRFDDCVRALYYPKTREK